MSQTTIDQGAYSDAAFRLLGDQYLLLIHENYLDEDARNLRARLGEFVADTVKSKRVACLCDLARGSDWREAVVGLHLCLLLTTCYGERSPGFALRNRLLLKVARRCGELGTPAFPTFALAARPAVLFLFALHRTAEIGAFLAGEPFASEASDVYAAALVADSVFAERAWNPALGSLLAHLRANAPHRAALLNHLESEDGFDAADFTASGARFLRAHAFWSEAVPLA